MSPYLISFFAAAGIATWVYNKTMRYTGNNTPNSLTIAGVTAVIVFIVFLTILNIVDSNLGN